MTYEKWRIWTFNLLCVKQSLYHWTNFSFFTLLYIVPIINNIRLLMLYCYMYCAPRRVAVFLSLVLMRVSLAAVLRSTKYFVLRRPRILVAVHVSMKYNLHRNIHSFFIALVVVYIYKIINKTTLFRFLLLLL